MDNPLKPLENIAYRICGKTFGIVSDDSYETDHPFDARNIHPAITAVSKQLFDDGHYRQASLYAFIRIEEQVREKSSFNDMGFNLMMSAFNEDKPIIALNNLSNTSERDEQKGYRHIFAGSMAGIRNPRAHSTTLPETMDECIDNLSIASALMRKLDHAPKRSKKI